MKQIQVKAESDHPVEDIFGDEILMDDEYYKFGHVVVLEQNLKLYLINHQAVECYKAG